MSYTKGPWKWWTSNSWRRLVGGPPGEEKMVAEPTTHPEDGHLNIAISLDDMAFMERAVNCHEELLIGLKRLAYHAKRMDAFIPPQDNSYDAEAVARFLASIELAEAAIAKAEEG